MLKINTLSGQLFQTVYVNEDDVTYNDILKYINIPRHPKFEKLSSNGKNYYGEICVKQFVKLFHETKEIDFNDNIDFNKELSILFYCEYYIYFTGPIKIGGDFTLPGIFRKLCDDFTLPVCDTYDKCKACVDDNPHNIIFVNNKFITDELCKTVVINNGYLLKYIPIEKQSEEICKLAVQWHTNSLRWVKNQTDEICKLAVQQDGYSLRWVKNQTDEICKWAIEEHKDAINFVRDPIMKSRLITYTL